ncbi:hypothetical protein [Ascidiimonas sp. W6]|uniref:hypothetical protein n=1 Tax=Ascidiimonas meishanensis TaxID=3128903 RepID=UPI0030EC8FFF
MEEDLEHIDLIDKYLNDVLSEDEQLTFEKLTKKSPSFRRDLEAYQQIYKGLEATKEDGLKARLPKYYEAFKQDKKQKDRRGKVRQLVLVGISIAAIVVLGWFLIFNQEDQNSFPIVQPDDLPPKIENKDSIKREELKKIKKNKDPLVEKPKDTITKSTFPKAEETVLSLGGMIPLAKDNVKSVIYPSMLSYIFNGKQLQLYGDPLIPALRIKVGRTTKGAYVLQLKNDYYSIEINEQKTPLRPSNLNFIPGTTPQEEIEIVIKDIREESNRLSNLKVFVKKEKEAGVFYRFEKQEDKTVLAINGDLNMKSTLVWQLDYKGKSTYYLQLEDKLYQLFEDSTEFIPLIPLDLLKSDKTKLFRNRTPIKKQLIIWE